MLFLFVACKEGFHGNNCDQNCDWHCQGGCDKTTSYCTSMSVTEYITYILLEVGNGAFDRASITLMSAMERVTGLL